MPEFCTCGAQLPADARFCHRCGKPQREEDVPELTAPAVPPVIIVAPAPTPARLNFHNRTAVRIALMMAGIASLLSASGAAGPAGLVVWWLTAGFLSVYLYRRRTGQHLTVDSGLRMGWITGLLGSTIMSVLSTISLVALIRGGAMVSLYREQLRKMSGSDANVQEALRIIQTPSGMTLFVVMAMVFLFLIITFLATAGGALGAKLVGGVAGPRA